MAVNFNNVQFSQFVQFAERQANPKDSEAIARVSDSGDAIAGRNISASGSDRVHHWYNIFSWRARSDSDATRNNEARNVFRQSVYDMFGGEKHVPESVKSAMLLGDYDQGKPLTARRIIAVRDAIIHASDKVGTGAIGKEKAGELVDGALEHVNNSLAAKNPGAKGISLDPGARAQAVELVKTYGRGLTDTSRRILANYVVTAAASGCYTEGNRLATLASSVSGYLKNVRSFKSGDFRLAELDRQMKDYWQDSIADGQLPDQNSHYDEEGLFDIFKVDTGRADFTIDGQDIAMARKNATTVANKFKETIVNPQQRRIISSVMNQGSGLSIISTHTRNNLTATTNFPGLNLMGIKGSELILTVPAVNPFFEANGMVEYGTPKFVLSVEGNKAKVTSHMPADITFNCKDVPGDWTKLPMGKIDNYIEFEFDISDPNTAVLTDVHSGQTIEV